MREKEDNWNWYYDLWEGGGLIITPDNKCIINSLKKEYHQFIWDGYQTDWVSISVLKHILLKKYDELEKFMNTFNLD